MCSAKTACFIFSLFYVVTKNEIYFALLILKFLGKHCQSDIDECNSTPCLNGGTCIDQPNGYHCNCTEQWMGSNCERVFDICETKPCSNNGTCTTASNKHDFTCICAKGTEEKLYEFFLSCIFLGFEGPLCNMNIDECEDVVCPKGHICEDLVGGYDCRCPPGYGGEDCSILTDPCAQKPCAYGGTCVLDTITHNFSCSCQPGYTGKFIKL